ncbi:MAG: hypothetical protein UT60_C0025G0002 [candidate division CPR2 bacterium GW2011_GWD2_39_7]|nr:MAG: hypothetical protein UT60_C0025G0002 [candidate division CPR2 bacterium GW2011_GWD2_39_7]KKR28635.1 MAG: hypothetical protein UT59_C0022G0003 [candidate division CPR2 bacterium GW2011_GWD1_39_7]
MMTYNKFMVYLYTALIGAIGSFVLGITVFRKNITNPINLLFFIFTIFLAFYNLFNHFFYGYSGDFTNGLGLRAAFFIGALLAASGATWALALCKGYNKKITASLYAIAALISLFTILNISYFDNVAVIPRNDIMNYVGITYYAQAIFNITLVLYAIFILIRTTFKTQGIVKEKLIYIDTGLIIFAVTSLTTDIALPFLGINSLSYLNNITSLIFVSFSAYAMIKFKDNQGKKA